MRSVYLAAARHFVPLIRLRHLLPRKRGRRVFLMVTLVNPIPSRRGRSLFEPPSPPAGGEGLLDGDARYSAFFSTGTLAIRASFSPQGGEKVPKADEGRLRRALRHQLVPRRRSRQ